MLHEQEHLREFLLSGSGAALLSELYQAGGEHQQRRYAQAIERFAGHFGDAPVAVFSAPGRTELCGNHTDHQRGRVLAAAVTLDILAVVSPVDTGVIRLFSEDFDRMDEVCIDSLAPQAGEKGTVAALIRGVAARLSELGYQSGGFNAYTTSNVPIGSGLSSSAAFEVLLGTIQNHLYNEGKISALTIAKTGQYAENVYFGKPCGLLDQTSSSIGGVVHIDFSKLDAPTVEKLDVPRWGYDICIVNTGGSHADLTAEYASIPYEMREVAGYFGCTALREVDYSRFIAELGNLRKILPDRALLRAMHFFGENERVLRQVEALKDKRWGDYLAATIESGRSSFMLLQNVYPVSSPAERGNALALAMSEKLLAGNGAWRIHGGGFAGTIQAIVPCNRTGFYKENMESLFGTGSVSRLNIRPYGGHMLEIK
ncbi:MAG: galactokinase [Clostridiales bacterium]|nr:galactokinase [Clostridiales bacterium]